MERRISGHTGLLALIGSPVGHSGSPAMHNYSFERLGLDYAYVAFDIKVEEVKDAIAAMKTFKMRGFNVTMPCKIEAACDLAETSTYTNAREKYASPGHFHIPKHLTNISSSDILQSRYIG